VAYMDRERTLHTRLVERSAMLDLAPDAVFARDPDRGITFWNEAAEHMYGFSRGEALGRRPAELLQSSYPVPLAEIERILAEEGSWEGDIVQTTRAGRRITVTSRWGAVYDDEGQLSSVLEIDRDITDRLASQAREAEDERTRMSERLIRSQRLESLGQLAGGIAHDFNNLLAVITGYAGVLDKRLARLGDTLGAESAEALGDDVTQIREAAQRAAELTHQLLSFARQDVAEAAVIDVNATLDDMLGLLARTLGTHIRLSTELADDLPRTRIDAGQLGQIMVNLAVNSREAMPDGGRLRLETSHATFSEDRSLTHGIIHAGAYVRIRVSDSGVGMSPEVVEHAFDPFFTTRAVGEGTGLGLATVYGITQQAGGQVELYSEAGAGTTVTVLLPALDAPTTAAPRRLDACPAPTTGEETILVVEDQPALRDITAATVADAGYRVLVASGSREAIDIAADSEQAIDLLLTDVVMPDLLGQQLAQRLQATRPGLKVVFMSGFARASLPESHPLNGPLLVKPFTEPELLHQIAATLAD
jgi:PAS domain S-box-containing protein